MLKPDGRIDLNGKSFKILSSLQAKLQAILFPLSFRPTQSYQSGMRAFGSNRSKGKRKHAGVDLYAPKVHLFVQQMTGK
jgi:hypothetical protein